MYMNDMGLTSVQLEAQVFETTINYQVIVDLGKSVHCKTFVHVEDASLIIDVTSDQVDQHSYYLGELDTIDQQLCVPLQSSISEEQISSDLTNGLLTISARKPELSRVDEFEELQATA